MQSSKGNTQEDTILRTLNVPNMDETLDPENQISHKTQTEESALENMNKTFDPWINPRGLMHNSMRKRLKENHKMKENDFDEMSSSSSQKTRMFGDNVEQIETVLQENDETDIKLNEEDVTDDVLLKDADEDWELIECENFNAQKVSMTNKASESEDEIQNNNLCDTNCIEKMVKDNRKISQLQINTKTLEIELADINNEINKCTLECELNRKETLIKRMGLKEELKKEISSWKEYFKENQKTLTPVTTDNQNVIIEKSKIIDLEKFEIKENKTETENEECALENKNKKGSDSNNTGLLEVCGTLPGTVISSSTEKWEKQYKIPITTEYLYETQKHRYKDVDDLEKLKNITLYDDLIDSVSITNVGKIQNTKESDSEETSSTSLQKIRKCQDYMKQLETVLDNEIDIKLIDQYEDITFLKTLKKQQFKQIDQKYEEIDFLGIGIIKKLREVFEESVVLLDREKYAQLEQYNMEKIRQLINELEDNYRMYEYKKWQKLSFDVLQNRSEMNELETKIQKFTYLFKNLEIQDKIETEKRKKLMKEKEGQELKKRAALRRERYAKRQTALATVTANNQSTEKKLFEFKEVTPLKTSIDQKYRELTYMEILKILNETIEESIALLNQKKYAQFEKHNMQKIIQLVDEFESDYFKCDDVKTLKSWLANPELKHQILKQDITHRDKRRLCQFFKYFTKMDELRTITKTFFEDFKIQNEIEMNKMKKLMREREKTKEELALTKERCEELYQKMQTLTAFQETIDTNKSFSNY